MSSELESFVAALQFNNYLSLVIVTVVTYDYIITLPKEIRYIWNRPWTVVSFMFILVRYVGLIVALLQGLYGSTFIPGPTLVSTVLLLVYDWAFIVFLAAAEIVMILRVYAMYNKSRIIMGVLLVLCAATIILVAVATAFYNNPDTYLTMLNPQVLNMSFCAPTYTTASKLGRYKLVPRLTLAALMFILVVARLCMESFQMYKATNQWKVNQYLNLLVREGVLYFLVHLLNNIDLGATMAGSVMTALIFILMFILSPRFIINVRELYLHKLLRGSGLGKGIDSGFGMWDNQSSRVAASSVGFADLRTPGIAEGDVEMQGVGNINDDPRDAKQARLLDSRV